ncbi:MAG: NYN domain-containing protein [Chloroflexota bacterium]
MTRNIRNQSQRIAMLIDGDNAQASLIEKMLVETTKYGVASVRRIYGDWTEATMNQWKKVLHSHAIQPIQQFRYTVGKNITDSALIIDAMDLLHSRRVDSFCIVSSDSDYTRLATRIREEGMFVIGMGKKSTPNSFVVACDVFVQVENLTDSEPEVPLSKTSIKSNTVKVPIETSPDKPEPLPLLFEAFHAAMQENGWASLSTMGNVLRQIRPDFDTRTYGFKQLGQLFRALPDFFEFSETGDQIRLIDEQLHNTR